VAYDLFFAAGAEPQAQVQVQKDLSMVQKIFVHVGMPKCASSTIQSTLWHNRDVLAGMGIHYGLFAQEEAQLQGNGASLAHAIWTNDTEAADRRIDYFLSLGERVLISAEAFSNVFNSGGTGRMFREMRARGAQVQVICFLRRQDLWIESDYKQQIKGGHPWTDPIEVLIAQRRAQEVLNFAWTMAYWVKFAGIAHTHAVALNPGQPKDYPLLALWDFIGIDKALQDRLVIQEDANISPPAGLIEPARLLKKALMARDLPDVRVAQMLGDFFERAPLVAPVPARRFLMRHAARSALVESCHPGNVDLRRKFFGQHNFDPLIAEDPASELPLAAEAQAIFEAYAADLPELARSRRRGLFGARPLARLRGTP
jgi:hypothetical protein